MESVGNGRTRASKATGDDLVSPAGLSSHMTLSGPLSRLSGHRRWRRHFGAVTCVFPRSIELGPDPTVGTIMGVPGRGLIPPLGTRGGIGQMQGPSPANNGTKEPKPQLRV